MAGKISCKVGKVSQVPKKFVVQQHTTAASVHWDLMLESGDALQTWRLHTNPDKIVNDSVEAVKIFDHPLKFLTYEGPVNEGRGRVQIADVGTYEITSQTDDQIEINLTGRILKGKFTMTCIKDDKCQFSKNRQ